MSNSKLAALALLSAALATQPEGDCYHSERHHRAPGESKGPKMSDQSRMTRERQRQQKRARQRRGKR